VEEDLNAPSSSSNGHASGDGPAVLELRGVSKTFRDFWMRPRVKAVRSIDLSAHRGEVLGLLGPNGSGKTTTIKMILGLLHATGGQIAVLGKRPSDVALKSRIGYLPEESNLYRFLNAGETLDFYGRLFKIPASIRKQRVEDLLDMVGLTAARYRPVGEYSKGMQRRVGLAQALINDPDLLILDEPTTGMDPIATRQIKDLILKLRNRGKTILLCTHLLGEVEDVCDRIVIMYGGKIRAEGTTDTLLRVPDLQSLDISGGALDGTTIERISAVLHESGHEVADVHRPKRKLEDVFMDVIKQAERGGEATTGAAVGGGVAGFLAESDADTQQGDALLDSLSRDEPETVTPEPVTPVDPASPQHDDALLDTLDEQPAETTATTETAPPPSQDVDDSLLSDLSNSNDKEKP
jgi:ABC-2 type transport system ATP-binding protein